MADKYLLRVTAGPSYDPSTHKPVPVNTPTATHITSPVCDANISVRIQNYRGLPRNSPTTSPYFSHAPHTHDQYSIAFHLLPHKSIPGPTLVFGNDFDHPIRDRLPPGFNTAFRIAKWAIDPGLEGDVYSDTPHLYGNALSSVNVLRVGEKVKEGEEKVSAATGGVEENDGEKALEEGGEGEGVEWRKERDVPEGADARKKWFLQQERKEGWEWEEGRVYQGDFFNPYLDFNGGFHSRSRSGKDESEFALKLPGFSLSILPFLGGHDSLRYVMKNTTTNEVLFVVVFTLLHKEDVDKEEAEGAEGSKPDKTGESKEDGTRHEGEKNFEPRSDDLD
ncbi:hypothetical protein MMC28_005644 [Mycoblastus sanguinarius]|nr:hypothetical protein [Mycoblastus sanguinarius]